MSVDTSLCLNISSCIPCMYFLFFIVVSYLLEESTKRVKTYWILISDIIILCCERSNDGGRNLYWIWCWNCFFCIIHIILYLDQYEQSIGIADRVHFMSKHDFWMVSHQLFVFLWCSMKQSLHQTDTWIVFGLKLVVDNHNLQVSRKIEKKYISGWES